MASRPCRLIASLPTKILQAYTALGPRRDEARIVILDVPEPRADRRVISSAGYEPEQPLELRYVRWLFPA
jgi:hypothetical protein